MKRFVVFALLALIGIFVTGRVSLGESGAMRFVMKMDSLMVEGKGEQVCDMLHDDFEFEIADHSHDRAQDSDGGKEDYCKLMRIAAAGLSVLPHTMRTDFNDVTVNRSWLHPWTSETSYSEDRTLTIRGANAKISTTSDITITLVQTFSGVKLLKLQGEAWAAE